MATKNKKESRIFVFLSLLVIICMLSIIILKTTNTSNKLISNTKAAPPPAIISGQPAKPDEWPFMVLLYDKKKFKKYWIPLTKTYGHNLSLQNEDLMPFICGGSLIGKEWVLTAAHCVNDENKKNIGVAIGFTNLTEKIDNKHRYTVDISEKIIHPGYDPADIFFKINNFDIALLKLSYPQKNNFIYPSTISLPSFSNLKMTNANSQVTFLGWGYSGGQQALAENLNIGLNTIQSNERKLTYKKYGKIYSEIDHGIILGNKSSTCYRDSGGPLLTIYKNMWYLIGTVSSSANRDSPCKDQSYFTNTAIHQNWIEMITGIKNDSGTF